jgi:hypothetical protein
MQWFARSSPRLNIKSASATSSRAQMVNALNSAGWQPAAGAMSNSLTEPVAVIFTQLMEYLSALSPRNDKHFLPDRVDFAREHDPLDAPHAAC